MRRDDFLKTLAALAAAGALPLSASAAANLKMMIPANPGGGWDTTGRALGKALQEAKRGRQRHLRQQGRRRRRAGPGAVRQRQQGRPERADGDGRRDAGRHHHRQAAGQPVAGHADRAPDQRIQRVRAAGQFAAEDDEGRGRADEEGPGQRQVGRRLARLHRAHRGGHDRAEVGVDPSQDQLRAFRGGGEATAAILGGNVTVGGSGYSEFAELHQRRQDARDRRHLADSA